MSRSTKDFKEMLQWQLFCLSMALRAEENLREQCKDSISNEEYTEWLDNEKKDICNKRNCIIDTMEAYRYTFEDSENIFKNEYIKHENFKEKEKENETINK